MYKAIHALVLSSVVTLPALANDGPLSGNLSLTSNYLFRGVSQTQDGPAVQGGIDYTHPSGFYVGTWASNVAWVKETGLKDNNSLEIDLYGGYKGEAGPITYDLGLIHYHYPGRLNAGATTPNTTEVYAGIGWSFLSLKYSYVVSDYFVGWTTSSGGKTRGSYYVDLSAAHELGGGWGVSAHVGYQDVKDNDPASYTDWNLAVSKDLGFGTLSLKYSDTDADTATYTWGASAKKVANGAFALTFSKTF
ncbi:MAG: TorF family putative porin [Thiobacillaceae bacterium]